MNILFTICARAGSKGAVGKNVRMFCERPLVYYTLEIYEKYLKKNSDKMDKIRLAVNTDSEQLLDQIRAKGTDFIYVERKKELAGDVVAKTEVVRDTLIVAEQILGEQFQITVDLDVTSPLRTLNDIEGAIKLVMDDVQCNYAYSVTESRRNPYFNMVCKKDNGFYDRVIPSEYTARQQLPECFDMNASIYVFEREYLINLCTENRRAMIWRMHDSLVLDIDSDDDFEMMQVLAGYYWKNGRYTDILS